MRTSGQRTGSRAGALLSLASLLLAACGTADPVALPAVLQLSEGSEVHGTLQASGTAGRRVTFAMASGPAHGALRLDAETGAFAYRVEPYYNGLDQFSFTANASGQTSAPATVTLQVAAVNDRPAAQGLVAEAAIGGTVLPDGVVELHEDGFFSGRLQAIDPDMQVLTFQVEVAPTGGTLELDPGTGVFTYRPVAHWSGVDRFTYTATDGGLTSDPATVTLVVAPVNDAPTGLARSDTVEEDGVLSGRVAATDLDSTALTYAVAGQPAHGTLTLDAATGAFTYRPFPDFSGSDTFAFTASDGLASSLPATVAITVVAVNDAPVASGQAFALDEDGVFAGQLSGTDVDGPLLVYAVETPPAHGSLELDPGTGAFTYRPAPNYFGTDAFAFTASDGLLASAPAAVTITVNPVNDAPVALGQQVSLDEDGQFAGQLAAVDLDGDALTYAVAFSPAHGTLQLDPATGVFTYRPDPDYFGADQFAFVASDGLAASAQATVLIAVAPVNDAPVAQPQSISLDEDAELTGQVTASDVDGDALTYAVATPPAHGVVTVNAGTGGFSYRPAPDYNGPDAFTFTASDGSLASQAASVAITVRPVNDAPSSHDLSIQVDEDATAAGRLMAEDPDGDALRFAVVTAPLHGKLEVDGGTGLFTYTPRRDFHGRDAFQFTASDAVLTTEPSYVEVVVLPVDDPPTATAQRAIVPVDGYLTGVLGGVDPEGAPVAVTVASWPLHGTLAFDAATSVFSYHPAAGYVGQDAFTFLASDSVLQSPPAMVDIQVTASAPVAPQIVFQQGATKAVAGQVATLGVTASGQTPLHFVWWRDGRAVPESNSPILRWGPVSLDDDATAFAVSVYDAVTSSTSLPWVVRVVERSGSTEIHALASNEADLYPGRQALAVRSVTRTSLGVGATISLLSDTGFPSVQAGGMGLVATDEAAGSLTVSFEDSGLPEVQSASVLLSSSGLPDRRVELSFANAAWMAANGRSDPAEVTITALDLPEATTRVEDWAGVTPTAEDVAFAQATWGPAVVGLGSPMLRAQALARRIIDELEGHRGVPSDRMSRSHPFEQWRLAVTGQELVWCTNIAAIFTHAAKSLGIPARTGALGRTESLGSEYILQSAEGHATTEIFDEQLNRWVWIDATVYALGMSRPGVGWLSTAEVLESLDDWTRRPTLQVLEYDPAARADSASAVDRSAALASLERFFRRESALTYWRSGLSRPSEYLSNEGDLFPGEEVLGLKSLQPLPAGYGVRILLSSAMAELDHFEYRTTYDSNGTLDRAVHASPDGAIDIAFANAHATVGQALIVGLRAIARDGQATPEHFVMVSYYSRELYQAFGLTNPGMVIFDGRGLRQATSTSRDWISDVATLAEAQFARQEWGALASGAQTPLEAARRIAGSLIAGLMPFRGVPSDAMNVAPFEQYRRSLQGLDAIDSRGLSAIFVRACSSLGIPARVVETGRILSEEAGYRLLGAAQRASVEVFDAGSNRWVWMDLGDSLLGMELEGFGLLNTAEAMRAFSDAGQLPSLIAHTYDATLGIEVSIPASLSPETQAVATYFRTRPRLRYARAAP